MYIEQPQGFEVHGKESHVCRLKKALYGLKQAPRAWYSRIDTYLQGTVDYGLDYRQGDGVRLVGYTDSDWAGCASDRKSTSGLSLIHI